MLIDLLADKHRLDGFVNFLTQIIGLCAISAEAWSLNGRTRQTGSCMLVAVGNLEVG